jgi:uncharacterized membrane protein YkgB
MKCRVVFPVIVGIIMLILIIPIGKYITYERLRSHDFVTSKYSKYCYKNQNVNKNIKEKIYYKTLALCGKPLK